MPLIKMEQSTIKFRLIYPVMINKQLYFDQGIVNYDKFMINASNMLTKANYLISHKRSYLDQLIAILFKNEKNN